MSNELNNILAYHGTSYDGEKGILRERKFNPSENDDEWIGKGIYYFIGDNAKENSLKWAKNVKRFKYSSIVEASIHVESSKILNLDEYIYQQMFHEYKEAFLNIHYKNGIKINENEKNSVKKLDCMIIDNIAKKGDFEAITQSRYIELRKRKMDVKLIASNIPNCRILCVKNLNIINSDSIKCIGRERNDD
ncbi:hypothetical protein [Clostridium nigeriense]|uniref:hypothetical protein n=1 Tax=Clostridium nigeriense TaxID=1805470 RepID=UPI00082AF55F|nr:hypothetical protein [Clostridium nigeriense]